jgi:hypothetical protein
LSPDSPGSRSCLGRSRPASCSRKRGRKNQQVQTKSLPLDFLIIIVAVPAIITLFAVVSVIPVVVAMIIARLILIVITV